jgi:hypothetical protein
MSLATLTAVKQVHNQFLRDEFLYISADKNAEELPSGYEVSIWPPS